MPLWEAAGFLEALMVHPFNPKTPMTVPNSYVVTAKGDFTALLDEVAGLAAREGNFDIKCDGRPDINTLFIKCDSDFAEKLKELPHVGCVESARRIIYMNKPAPGP